MYLLVVTVRRGTFRAAFNFKRLRRRSLHGLEDKGYQREVKLLIVRTRNAGRGWTDLRSGESGILFQAGDLANGFGPNSSPLRRRRRRRSRSDSKWGVVSLANRDGDKAGEEGAGTGGRGGGSLLSKWNAPRMPKLPGACRMETSAETFPISCVKGNIR